MIQHSTRPPVADPRATADRLKRWALAAGFDRAGVATLEPSKQGHHFRRWLARGEHAGMEWLTRRVEVREDPARLLEGSRSALCVALQYYPLTGEGEPDGDLWPRVARYARGRDYHQVMGKRLRSLAERIRQAFPGCGTRPYVDTGPILERELAARAGLGVQGKNTQLLHREAGSWFLLGELLLTLDLEPDEPIADLCGHCTRCLEACPTGALVEPYRLDSNRCISYWTIEHRGELPAAAREMIGDWVFGCDICQEVCPWNQPTRPGGRREEGPSAGDHPQLRLPPERAELDLAGLLELGREGYVKRFQVSAMKRAKLEGLRRNAAVAMGNRGDQRYVPALARTLEQAEPMLARHVAWALGRIGGADAEAALETVRDSDAPEVREVHENS